MEKNKRTKINVRPSKNGLVLRSRVVPELGTEVFFTDQGDLKTRQVIMDSKLILERITEYEIEKRRFKMAFACIADTCLLLGLLTFTRNIGIIFSALYFIIFSSFAWSEFIFMVYHTKSKSGLNYKRARLEAISNKLSNAAYEHGDVLSVKEISDASIIKPNRKWTELMFKVLIHPILGVSIALFSALDIWWYILALIVILIIGIIVGKTGAFDKLQVLVLNSPDAEDLLLGMYAYEEYMKQEKYMSEDEEFKNAKGYCFITVDHETKVMPVPYGKNAITIDMSMFNKDEDDGIEIIDLDEEDDKPDIGEKPSNIDDEESYLFLNLWAQERASADEYDDSSDDDDDSDDGGSDFGDAGDADGDGE